MGGATEFLGQPERRSIRTAPRADGSVEMRVSPSGSIRQDTQVRSPEVGGSDSSGPAALQDEPVDLLKAAGRGAIRPSLLPDVESAASRARGFCPDCPDRDGDESVG